MAPHAHLSLVPSFLFRDHQMTTRRQLGDHLMTLQEDECRVVDMNASCIALVFLVTGAQEPARPVWAEYTICEFILASGETREQAVTRAEKESNWSRMWTEWTFTDAKPAYVKEDTPDHAWWRNAAAIKPDADGANPRPPSEGGYFVRAMPLAKGEAHFPVWRVKKEAFLWYQAGATPPAAATAAGKRFLEAEKAPWMVLLRFRSGGTMGFASQSPKR
jgi:hypothetical protein